MADGGLGGVRVQADHPPPVTGHTPARGNGMDGGAAPKQGDRGVEPPRRVLLSPDDPKLTHAANAPVRAETMQALQRGVGNHAVQAMVTAAMSRASALGGNGAAGPGELAEGPDEAPEPPEFAEAETEQGLPARPPPLVAEPMRMEYSAGPALSSDALHFARHGGSAGGRAAQESEARASAERGYSDVRGAGQALHQEVLGETKRTIADAVFAHEMGAARLDAFEDRCGQRLDVHETQISAGLDMETDRALLRLRQAHEITRKGVLAAVRQAYGRVGAGDAHAKSEADTLIKDEQAKYAKAIDDAVAEVKKEKQAASDRLDDWLKHLDLAYPSLAAGSYVFGAGLQPAYNEARQKAAPAWSNKTRRDWRTTPRASRIRLLGRTAPRRS